MPWKRALVNIQSNTVGTKTLTYVRVLVLGELGWKRCYIAVLCDVGQNDEDQNAHDREHSGPKKMRPADAGSLVVTRVGTGV